MSTITKQWLQQKIAEMEEHRDLFPGDLDDDHGKVLSALRIALASLEAEPVAWRHDDRPFAGIAITRAKSVAEKWIANGWKVTPLYTAPPVPVSVPDKIEPTVEAIKRVLPTSNPDEYAACIGADMWNACRAAMLQGAEPVSNHDESQVVVLHMGQAMSVFEALKKEALSEHVRHTELGEIGAVNVQVWTSVLGGALQYETSNGGCTLRVIQAEPQQEAE